LVTGTSTPLLARFAREHLGAPAGLVGVIVGASSIGAIVLRPWFGRLADERGRRRVGIVGSVGIAAGAGVLILAHDPATGTLGRMLMGLTGGAANTAMMAWTIELAPIEQRGRALGLFGVSIWIGLAVGPQIGQMLLSAGGYTLLWCGCGAMGLCAAGCLLATGPTPRHASAPRRRRGPGGRDGMRLIRLVLRPGLSSMLAWAAEGTVLAFLAEHLERRGLPAGGLSGAATVFTVFAMSVIGSRLALSRLVDEVGAVRAAVWALVAVAAGLVILALAHSFGVAAAGAVLLGLGYAPLYPSLAVLASEPVAAHERARGIGIFSSFQDVGVALGSAGGGVIVAAAGTEAALLTVAAAQVVAILLLLVPGSGSSRASAPDS
jgi:MFS family permease